ncbi:MAG TPA: bi-domain-containing oxidoreductase [Blastocatellia bacterium]|nr:bi-domain-containing oxidoreductase [Blastocatellia bacterium]
MKQVIQNFRSGRLKVDEVPETICQAGGLLVDNVTSLISAGTEKMVIDLAQKSLLGKARERPDLVRQVLNKLRRDGLGSTLQTVKARLETSLALGYSCAGTVRETGRGVEEFDLHDRVACAGMNYASHAETVFVPKNLAVKIPEGVSFDEAAFVTLGAIALQGVRTAEVKLGETVAVIGLGLLGQLTVPILKAAGCRVIGIDLDPGKIALARAHGADLALARDHGVESLVTEFTEGRGVDAAIVTAASSTNDPIELAGAIARDRAVISVVGAVGLEVPRKIYYEKELQLRLSRSYGPGRYDPQYELQGIDYPIGYVRWTERRNMGEFLRLVSAKSIRLDQLITHRFPIEQAEHAYEIISGKRPEEYLGILLTYEERPHGRSGPRIVRLDNRRHTATGNVGKLGLIGAGNFARSVLLPRLARVSNLHLVGVATATGRNAKTVAEQYGFGFCCTDYQDLLAHDEIDTVIIATRHDTHARIAAEAVRAGKTVLVEKPLAISEAGLSEIAEAVDQTGGRVMVGFNRRFSDLSVELKQFFADAGPLSVTYRVNAGPIPAESWIQGEEGGGRVLGEVCHFVDYLQFLTDSEPSEVFAFRSAAGPDTLSLIVKLSEGSIGNINYFANGDHALPKERIEVYGGGRVAILDDFRTLERWHAGKRRTTKKLAQDKGFDQELSLFVRSVLNDNEMPIGWRSLMLTTLTTLKVVEALKSGRPEKVDLRFEI